ncbi:MAG: hypothetical protein UX49_C0005G0029 [Candidatus Wolfebacteria bacterium GW2011_GWC2_46_275]|uniref:Uncharacterized protein n=2 Tax=Candidatus Wolfeibacteriota TaxID=1752735 RepID=A0A0G1U6M2_9BACT|nr:MAG: hypothetical protein UX70_C0001G0916 [Candidatus Wolfebacteria bacterium GW2011_GWB1_47_1]KKU36952.1 MAG: hypothetical protein UX49_C0005G0029 [Candidatus Wolfebacteria bacterium GW2011_GWC2_46_275]KKU42201.1 MAG: hypothetical protein UX58_C0003G0126 [Candidatus Wolfebacteria bacterium GW2011_GWB2_46_69]KKU53824.1 MAG: hypothetical protein UX76_C0009G0014 [Candidatus Wolfebacteria bacterium GW2011_GWC1_47_103]KKU59447.1 MAG: hypothetical protein UX83_C0005G0066 [Candidatus Wolfebacteria
MDNQTNPTQDPAAPEKKVPEPPALEIDIRTMESDLKAFREGGGEVPTQGAQEAFASQRDAAPQAPAYTGPEKPLFETPMAPQMPTVPIQKAPQGQTSSGTMNMVLITIGIVIGIVGLGLLGYFVVFPYIFKLIG